MRTVAALRMIAVALVIGALLAVLGPFGTYLNEGPFRRAGYWITAALLGLALFGAAYKAVLAFTHPGSRLWWPILILITLLASVPHAFATRTGAFWLWPELAQLGLSWWLWYVQTTMIGMTAMLAIAVIQWNAKRAPGEDSLRKPRPELECTLLGRDVLALQMEDHYVRVHRANGSELILMPLARAIERVKTQGLRTHRSWWVAKHAVVSVEASPRSTRLHLTNGISAPVARSAITHLKAAGWLVRQNDDPTLL